MKKKGKFHVNIDSKKVYQQRYFTDINNIVIFSGLNTLGAISGLSDGLFNLGKTIIASGQADPHNGADPHHNAAQHGAQSAILKALQSGAFG